MTLERAHRLMNTRCRRRLARFCVVMLFAIIAILSGTSIARAQTLTLADMYYRITPSGTVNPNHSNLVRTLKFTWTNPGGSISVMGLKRDGVVVAGDANDPGVANTTYDHTWVSGTQYSYYLYGTQSVYNPTTMMYDVSPWVGPGLTVKPFDLAVGDNATADSRLDKRYGSVVYQDYKFNDSTSKVYTYRGGLYAGNNSDGSQVGRAFLKFALTGSTSAVVHPVGGLYVFSTRLAKTGSFTVAAQRATPSTWTQSTLVWSTAPTLTGTLSPTVSVSWNSASPATAWYKIPVNQLVAAQLTAGPTNPTLTIAVRGDSETGGGWAYFAMKEFTFASKTNFGARLLYALSVP